MSAEVAFQTLSVMGVVFSSLSALFGVYFVLFILAMWSTYRNRSKAQDRLRVVTVSLFVALCTHYIARALTFARARNMNPSMDEERRWTVPLVFVGALTSTITGFLSDGLVAWRCYVIYGRSRLAFYLPLTAVVINALLGLSGDFQQLTIYKSIDLYNNRFAMVALKVNAAWGWCIFGINTLLTGSIVGKIIYVSRKTSSTAHSVPSIQYGTVIEAIVESAMVTWVGLLLYEISTFAPTGHVTQNLDIGYVMVCIVPIFFGISQCLITTRLGFAVDNQNHTLTPITLSYPSSSASNKDAPGGMVFRVPTAHSEVSTMQTRKSIVEEPKPRLSLGLSSEDRGRLEISEV